MGSHDSELTIVMQDTNGLESTMDGQPYKAGHHAATLRRMLWREHLGLLPAQPLDASQDPNAQPPEDSENNYFANDKYDHFVADPMSDDLWQLWTGQATTNTNIFRQLFRADPDDNIRSFKDYENFLPPSSDRKQGHLYDKYASNKEIRAKLDQIRGHLVWMPLHFLEDAAMAERGLQVNAYTESVYT